MNYLVTGGVGFIGANFVKYILNIYNNCNVIILDKLTYAGNLGIIKNKLTDKRVEFYKGDTCNQELIENIFMNHDIDIVVNFAAESHVDRSMEDPDLFLRTNIFGTQTLLDIAKSHWSMGKDDKGYHVYKPGKKFLQVLTDDFYGDLEKDIPEGVSLSELVFEDGVINSKYKDFVKIKCESCTYDLINHIQDRLGHDAIYAIDPTKTVAELGFYPETQFSEGIRITNQWYLNSQWWVNDVTSGDYQKYYYEMYGNR